MALEQINLSYAMAEHAMKKGKLVKLPEWNFWLCLKSRENSQGFTLHAISKDLKTSSSYMLPSNEKERRDWQVKYQEKQHASTSENPVFIIEVLKDNYGFKLRWDHDGYVLKSKNTLKLSEKRNRSFYIFFRDQKFSLWTVEIDGSHGVDSKITDLCIESYSDLEVSIKVLNLQS